MDLIESVFELESEWQDVGVRAMGVIIPRAYTKSAVGAPETEALPTNYRGRGERSGRKQTVFEVPIPHLTLNWCAHKVPAFKTSFR